MLFNHKKHEKMGTVPAATGASPIAMMGAQAAASGIGGLFQLGADALNYRRNKKLMGLQNEYQKGLMKQQAIHQRDLDRYGADLQFEMWQKTNYPAQMAMLREAGLNPGLIYGQSGGGGTTTGSQGGGAATGGQQAMGQAPPPMNVADILNLQKLKAEIAAIQAQAEKGKAEADKIKGVDTEEAKSRININKGVISLNLSQEELNEASTKVKENEIEVQNSVKLLNTALAGLNDVKAAEAVSNTEINEATLEWMDNTGLHPSDGALAKIVNYLSRQTNITEENIIYILGGAIGARELLKLLPKELLGKLSKVSVKGFGGK